MKKFLIIAGVIFAVTGIIFIVLAARSGAFADIKPVEMKEAGPYTVVYIPHKGDYAKAGDIIDNVNSELVREYNIITHKSFGIYYDNPGKVKKENLRSDLGVILEGEAKEKAGEIRGDLKVRALERKKCPVTEFPYYNESSVVFGLIKAYPALNKYIKENDLENLTYSMEIYDIPGEKITYMLR